MRVRCKKSLAKLNSSFIVGAEREENLNLSSLYLITFVELPAVFSAALMIPMLIFLDSGTTLPRLGGSEKKTLFFIRLPPTTT